MSNHGALSAMATYIENFLGESTTSKKFVDERFKNRTSPEKKQLISIFDKLVPMRKSISGDSQESKDQKLFEISTELYNILSA